MKEGSSVCYRDYCSEMSITNAFTHRSLKKVQAQIRLEAMTCEIGLHTALSSEQSTFGSWVKANSVLYPILSY